MFYSSIEEAVPGYRKTRKCPGTAGMSGASQRMASNSALLPSRAKDDAKTEKVMSWAGVFFVVGATSDFSLSIENTRGRIDMMSEIRSLLVELDQGKLSSCRSKLMKFVQRYSVACALHRKSVYCLLCKHTVCRRMCVRVSHSRTCMCGKEPGNVQYRPRRTICPPCLTMRSEADMTTCSVTVRVTACLGDRIGVFEHPHR